MEPMRSLSFRPARSRLCSRGPSARRRCRFVFVCPFSALRLRPQHGSADGIGNSFGGGLDRIIGQMGIAGGGLHLGMAKQFADHRQAFPQGEGAAGVGMAQVVDAEVGKAGLLPDALPGVLQVGQAAAVLLAGDDVRDAVQFLDAVRDVGGGLAEMHHLRPGWQAQFAGLDKAAAGQHQQADGGDGRRCLGAAPRPWYVYPSGEDRGFQHLRFVTDAPDLAGKGVLPTQNPSLGRSTPW